MSTNPDFVNFTYEPGVSPGPTTNPSASAPGDDPYGYITTGKPHHENSHPVIVQSQGAVLALLDYMPSEYETSDRLATSFLFPINANTKGVLSAGNTLTGFGEASIKIPPVVSSDPNAVDLCQGVENAGTSSQAGQPFSLGQVFGMIEGQACAAFQIFLADGVNGSPATFSIVSDGNGIHQNAGRIIACHYQGASPPPTGTATVVKLGFYLQAGNCPNGNSDLTALMTSVKNLAITPQYSGTGSSQVWSVSVTPTGGPASLFVSQNISTGAIVSRQVGGQNVSATGFTVNQTDVFQFLLSNLPLF